MGSCSVGAGWLADGCGDSACVVSRVEAKPIEPHFWLDIQRRENAIDFTERRLQILAETRDRQ